MSDVIKHDFGKDNRDKTRTALDVQEKILVIGAVIGVIIAAMVVGVIAMTVIGIKGWSECNESGGTYVKVPFGYECIKR